MAAGIQRQMWREVGPVVYIAVLVLTVLPVHLIGQKRVVSADVVNASNNGWSQPVEITDSSCCLRSRWPDIAVDPLGDVHVVWVAAYPETEEEAVFYSRWDGDAWSRPVDIFFTSRPSTGEYFPPEVFIPMIAADRFGRLHLSWTDTYHLFYGWAWRDSETWNAVSWFGPFIITTDRLGPYSDIDVDRQGVVHVVYNGLPEEGEVVEDGSVIMYHDAYYVRSADGGKTWSAPFALSPNPRRDNRIRLTIDQQDILHVAWDSNNANDNQDGLEPWERGVYIRSTNGGMSWDDPVPIVYDGWVSYPKVVSDGFGNTLLAWAAGRVYTMWSSDAGVTWEAPSQIPAFVSIGGLDAVADAVGNIHLVVAGQDPVTYDPERRNYDIFYLVWDGQEWSEPVNVSRSPEMNSLRPKIAVSRGNTLHVVWQEAENCPPGQEEGTAMRIYHSKFITSAPLVTEELLPTPVSTSTPTANARTQSTARPTLATSPPTVLPTLDFSTVETRQRTTVSNQNTPLVVGVVSTTVLLVIVVLVRGRGRRSS